MMLLPVLVWSRMPRGTQEGAHDATGVDWFRLLEFETTEAALDAAIAAVQATPMLPDQLAPTSTTVFITAVASLHNLGADSHRDADLFANTVLDRATPTEHELLGCISQSTMVRSLLSPFSPSASSKLLLDAAFSSKNAGDTMDMKDTVFIEPTAARKADSVKVVRILGGVNQPRLLQLNALGTSYRVIAKEGVYQSVMTSVLVATVQEYLNSLWKEEGVAAVSVSYAAVPYTEKHVLLGFLEGAREATVDDVTSTLDNDVSVASIIGMLLSGQLMGIADRKNDNVMFDPASKQFINIDFGICHGSYHGAEGEIPVVIVHGMSWNDFVRHFHKPLQAAFKVLWNKRNEIDRAISRLSSILRNHQRDQLMVFVHKTLCLDTDATSTYTEAICFSEMLGRLLLEHYPIHDPRLSLSRFLAQRSMDYLAHFSGKHNHHAFKRIVETRHDPQSAVNLMAIVMNDPKGSNIRSLHSNQLDWMQHCLERTSNEDLPFHYLTKIASTCTQHRTSETREPLLLHLPLRVRDPIYDSPANLFDFKAFGSFFCSVDFEKVHDRRSVTLYTYPMDPEFDSRLIYPSLCRILNTIWGLGNTDATALYLACPAATLIGHEYVGIETSASVDKLTRAHLDAMDVTQRQRQFSGLVMAAYMFGFKSLDPAVMMYCTRSRSILHHLSIPFTIDPSFKFPQFISDYYGGNKKTIERDLLQTKTFIQMVRSTALAASRIETAFTALLALEDTRTKSELRGYLHPLIQRYRYVMQYTEDLELFELPALTLLDKITKLSLQ